MNVYQKLTAALKSIIEALGDWKERGLGLVIGSGRTASDDLERLGGKDLERNVRDILEQLGFDVKTNREVTFPGLDVTPPFDAYIPAPDNISPQKALVVEVKSSKKEWPVTDDLRQLDDYIYQLSGEERFRKQKIGLSHYPVWITNRISMPGWRISYPESYKGVLVFNCTKGTHFEARSDKWVRHDQVKFAQQRRFCVMTLKCLLAWNDAIIGGEKTKQDLWSAIHQTDGELGSPTL
jgi:hypothetical protein